jgi:aspartyl protease family protein
MPTLPRRHALALAAAWWGGRGARAQSAPPPAVALAGRMGERALLVVDGATRVLAPGQSAGPLRFVRWQDDEALVEVDGAALRLRVGARPTALAGAAPAAPAGREIVMTAGPGGHFVAGGAINGRAVQFMVDTGATVVAIPQSEAARLGIDTSRAQRAVTQTANGPVPVLRVVLGSVRVGEVQLANVEAVLLPAAMPQVLLGNSFLSRFQMRRDNDVMRLELR